MRNIAIVLAGGSGTRMGLGRPKQFLIMAGKTILEHSVDSFHANELIEAVIIVSNPDFINEVEVIVAQHRITGKWNKVCAVIPGGKDRSSSSINAIAEVKRQIETATPDVKTKDTSINLLLHDAVRPLVDQRIITDVCRALEFNSAVNVTLPVVDTIIRTATMTAPNGEEQCVMTDTVDRSTLQRVQTPQGFRLTTIDEAYRRALADPDFRATDDCGVVLRYMPEVPIALVRGSEHNLKLTYPEDIPLFEYLMTL